MSESLAAILLFLCLALNLVGGISLGHGQERGTKGSIYISLSISLIMTAILGFLVKDLARLKENLAKPHPEEQRVRYEREYRE